MVHQLVLGWVTLMGHRMGFLKASRKVMRKGKQWVLPTAYQMASLKALCLGLMKAKQRVDELVQMKGQQKGFYLE